MFLGYFSCQNIFLKLCEIPGARRCFKALKCEAKFNNVARHLMALALITSAVCVFTPTVSGSRKMVVEKT